MGKLKILQFLVLITFTLCMRTVTGNPVLDFTISDLGRRIAFSDSGQFETVNHAGVPWTFRYMAHMRDMESPSDFLAEFRLAIRFPGFGFFKTSFGDMTGDPRIAALIDGGFQLGMDDELGRRELIVRPVSIHGDRGGSFTISTDPLLPISAHLVLHAPMSGASRVGFAGTLFEFPLRAGIIRTAFALVQQQQEFPDAWIVQYHHEPVGTGWVGYWSWVGRYTIPQLSGSLQAGLLQRVSYDTLLGFGSSTVVQLDLQQGQWAFSFKQLDIDAFAGPIGSVSTNTTDSPQQELFLSSGFENSRMWFELSLNDKRWRPTVFAGASQRRTMSISGEVGFRVESWEGEISFDSTYRWNRSGTRSRTHTFAARFKFLVHTVHVSCEPKISMGKKVKLNGTYAFEKSLNGDSTIKLKLIHTAGSVEVDFSARTRLSVGLLEFGFGSRGEVSVRYSIVPGG